MRNPFRRQTETAAPSLRERAAALREGLSRQAAPTPAPAERADLYDRLLVAYAEDRAARPISGRDGDETARRAANLVLNRAWALARDVVSLPPPSTLEGLRASALASAMLCEAESSTEDPTTVAAIGLTRAVLAVTGTPLPPGFVGFGDEPDYKQRDRALFDPPGSLPAWAIAEIEAEDAANDDVQEATLEAHDLPSAILDGWATWGATTSFPINASAEELAAWERASEQRDRLLYAAMALPATPESIPAKALACAWMEWVNTERPGQSRDAYGPADQLVYDINATIMARGSQDTTLRPTPVAFDFGPDAHIAELAAEFCEAYAANIKADREHMAERMSEAEWLPHYQRATALMKKLEATEPKTLLGMALKCLGPIGAAGYNAPADESETQDDAWERVGTQFANAVLRDALAPLPTAGWHCSPVDLIAAAGLPVEMLPVSDLCAILDAAEILSSVAAAITCQPRQMTNKRFNGAGLLIEATAFALHRVIDAVAKELRGRTPADASDQANRLASLASLTIHNDDEAETAAFARELLAMVEP